MTKLVEQGSPVCPPIIYCWLVLWYGEAVASDERPRAALRIERDSYLGLGAVLVNGSEVAREAQLVTFDRAGDAVSLEANSDATVLLLSGEPIDEPIVGYGPFVMNSKQEIQQAIADFNGGKFGRMAG